MQRVYNYFIIIAYCMFSFSYIQISTKTVSAFLIAIILLCFSVYFDNKIITCTLFSCYAITGLFFPILYFFVPILICEPVRIKKYSPLVLVATGIIINFLPLSILQHKNTFIRQFNGLVNNNNGTLLISFFFITLGCIISLFIDWQCRRNKSLELQYKNTRDDSAELNFLLQDNNRLLIEKRDYEIHTAMLKERNRIAREIHDHVGHMLSRCILLTGMIKTINKDENCAKPLKLLDNTLAETMDSVRNSVHNLHNEALNLEEKISELVANFTFCTAKLYYDMSPDITPPVKYAILSITTEALTNVSKHSNATLVQIRILEHPNIYQLIITDNGSSNQYSTPSENEIINYNQTKLSVKNRDGIKNTCYTQKDMINEHGIGLQNIKDRVASLNGILNISCEKGFSIFISIPKKEK